jgi:hypothetical protein
MLDMLPLSKAKAREELMQTGVIYYDVLPANHPDVEKNFDGFPSKEAIAYIFSANMVNGVKELCKFPFGVGYKGPLFPMNLVEHQPMLLAGELKTNEQLTKCEQDMYKQYSEINEETCHPHRMARAIEPSLTPADLALSTSSSIASSDSSIPRGKGPIAAIPLM